MVQITEWLHSGAENWMNGCSMVQTADWMTAQWCRRLTEWLLSGADGWLNAQWCRQLIEWLLSGAHNWLLIGPVILDKVYIRKIVQECLHPLLGRGVDHLPSSSADVKERVQLYLYFSSESSWPVIGRNLTLKLLYRHPLWPPETPWVSTKKASGPDPDLKELNPNPLTHFLYYAFYYNPPIHWKFPNNNLPIDSASSFHPIEPLRTGPQISVNPRDLNSEVQILLENLSEGNDFYLNVLLHWAESFLRS
jgi:hypothetical protein